MTTPTTFAAKGSRVRVRILVPKPLGSYSVAGAQPKFVAEEVTFTGKIAHVRGNHPTAPTSIRVWVEPDDPQELGPHQATLARANLWGKWCQKCRRDEVGPIDPDHVTVIP